MSPFVFCISQLEYYEENFRIEADEGREGKASPAVFSHSLRRFTVLPWGMNQNEKSTAGENINLKTGRQNEK